MATYIYDAISDGTAGPLVTALTAATIEAANVCRWKDLPDLYSRYGSCGIPIIAVFQSWSQGIGVFSKKGMLKLWSALNVKLYGGGVAEDEFLRTLSELIGTSDKETTSASYNNGVRSTTSALRREKILEVADLTSMGRGRAIMLSSGASAASSGPANTAPVSPIASVMPPLEAQPVTDIDAAQDTTFPERVMSDENFSTSTRIRSQRPFDPSACTPRR